MASRDYPPIERIGDASTETPNIFSQAILQLGPGAVGQLRSRRHLGVMSLFLSVFSPVGATLPTS